MKLRVLALFAVTSCGASAPAFKDAFAINESIANEVGPRLAGSDGDPKAVAWALHAMRALGLANVHAEPVTVPVWVRGKEEASIAGHALSVTALGGSVATPAEGIDAQVVVARSLAELSTLEDRAVAGRIVFVDAPMPRAPDGHGYGDGVGARVAGPSIAAKKGAVAFVLRSVGTDATDAPHTGVLKYDDAAPRIPAAALSNIAANALAAALDKDGTLGLHLVLTPHALPDAQSANVVGDVVGTTSEIVLLGAHLDSWDLGRGAIDDGSGIAIVLEAARLAHKTKPRRTIRVVLFASEENSGAGGRAYASAHASDATVAAMEADTGCGAPMHVRWLGDPARASVFDPIAAALTKLHLATQAMTAEGGSDVGPLRALGVPIVDVRQDMSAYFDVHHTRNDRMTAVDGATLERTAEAFAEIAWDLANVDGDLGRVPEDKRTRSH